MKKRPALICAAVFLCFTAGCGAGGNSASENDADVEHPPAATQEETQEEEETAMPVEQADDGGGWRRTTVSPRSRILT